MFITIIFYLYLASAFILYLYLLIYLIRILKIKREQNDDSKPTSVVICARNELENLKELLPILYQQTHPDYEIIVVDDRSGDDTYDFLLEEVKHQPKLRYVVIDETPPHVNGKKYGLTLGIKAAKKENILLIDADCRPKTSYWIDEMTSVYDNSTIFVLGYSQYLPDDTFLNLFIRFETLFTGIQYISAAIGRKPYMGVGRNLSYKKPFFLEKKGFNKILKITGGDDDLFVNEHATKSNTKVVVGEDVLVYSIAKKNLKEYIRQKVRHIAVSRRYKFKHKFRLGMYPIMKMVFWITFVVLISNLFMPYQIILGYLLLLVFNIILFQKASAKFGDKFPVAWLPILDFLHLFYFLYIGGTAFLTKKVKWK